MAMKATKKMALLSIATSIATLALKFGAYFLTDSVSLLSDALEALVNLANLLRAEGQFAAARSLLEPALAAYLQAVAANWVSAGVRLIPLGQSDGQRVLAGLEPAVTATVQRALSAKLDDLGSSAFRADLASARHETQYTRLFRS